ncbi:MAG: YdeI/OmpD-associated family protein [Pseudomonadota bacterium]
MTADVFFPFAFETPIEKFGVGKKKVIWYNVLIVPDHVCKQLPLSDHPRLRIEGEIADVPVANALMPTGDGRYYVIVAPNVLKDGNVRLGHIVEMRFRIADQDHVDVPPELERAIVATETAQAHWQSLTPGKKRMLAKHVRSSKTALTRVRRTDEAIAALLHHGADLRAWRASARRSK